MIKSFYPDHQKLGPKAQITQITLNMLCYLLFVPLSIKYQQKIYVSLKLGMIPRHSNREAATGIPGEMVFYHRYVPV